MPGYFSTLNTALKALQVQKKSLDVTGHNIANANTEGYSRQRAVHSASDPYTVVGMGMPTGAGQVGTGVELAEIARVRDQFLDGQINEEKQSLGYWEKRYEGLHRIELTFNEPSDSSLGTIMNQFWDSLEDLSGNSEDPAVREIVKQTALTLTDTFHSLHDQLTDYKSSLNDDVTTMVSEINSIARRVADLNSQIAQIKGAGKEPNDLLDRRDLLFEELNTMVNAQGRVDQRGNLNISIGGVSLVAIDDVHLLDIEKSTNPGEKYEDKIVFAKTRTEAIIESGELAGVLNIRGGKEDGEIDSYLNRLDNLARTLKESFNEVHRAGYDFNGKPGKDFFVGDDAYTLNLSNDISDPNNIAAGQLVDNPGIVALNEINTTDGYSYEIEVTENADPGIAFDYTIVEKDEEGNILGSYSDDLSLSEFQDESFVIDTGTNLSGQLKFTIEEAGTANVSYDIGSGGGDNALRLAKVIKEEKLFNDSKATMLDYYKSTISIIGIDGQRANQMVNNQSVLTNQLNNQRISISGVSLDEEMANMIQYQQAYTAASKVITTIDQMLDSLMGIIR